MESFFREIGQTYPQERRYFSFDPEIPLTKDYLSKLVNEDFRNFEMIEIEKENGKGFRMGWHLDDYLTHKNSKKHQEKYNSPKYNLYTRHPPPKYTAILYYSTQNEDFEGGEFCFLDEEVKPEKYQGIFFNSKEPHQVKEIKSGIRKCKLFKFYCKNYIIDA